MPGWRGVFDSAADPFPTAEKRGGANNSLATIQQIGELHDQGVRVGELGERQNLSRENVRRWIKRKKEAVGAE